MKCSLLRATRARAGVLAIAMRIARAAIALMLCTPFAASAWPPHRVAISPAVDAWSHEDACAQYCVNRFGSNCVSGTLSSFVRRTPTGGDGDLSCSVSRLSNGNVVTDVFGAAYVTCQVGAASISADGNSCRCSSSTRWTGESCISVCPSGQFSSGTGCSVTNIDPGKSHGQSCPHCGNPVNPATGNKFEAETDYVGQGAFPLMLRRYYNSAVGPNIKNFRQPAAFGFLWSGEYSRSLSLSGFGTPGAVSAYRQDGRVYVFRLVGSDYQGDADVNDRLTAITDSSGTITGWSYVVGANEEIETYDAEGALLSISNRAGLTTTFAYDANKYLVQATDAFGKTLTFSYDALGRVSSITDPAGGSFVYAYDTADRLVSVTFPDTKVRSYQYEDASFPLALTGITDEDSQRFATWSFDAQGRATLSEYAGGANHVTLTYGTNSAQVTDAFGQARTYSFLPIQGIGRNTSIAGPVCPSCGPAAQTFDTNGNVASRADWNGHVTTYQYDSARNLETSRTEGSGSPQARTITTAWHPTFRLPVTTTEPGRETTMSYDGSGNLLTRSVRDTATNETRTWTYTYNANGRVLTMDGPRTDVSDVTTYTYYANNDADLGKRGNLASVTTPLGHVTQILAYNAHGQPTQIVDPNGLTTTLTYDPRQRLTSRQVGNETTTYTYDGVGQLTRVTLPDASYVDYTYDAAHRLTQIQDNTGNKIAYTVDAMGNRTQEQTFDPGSNLVRTLSRVYDSLNRLQQYIGAQ